MIKTLHTIAALALTCALYAPDAVLAQTDVRLGNDAIRVDVDDNGLLALGTTGGAPDITGDEDKRLMFGWERDRDASSTSFSSVRISDTNGVADFSLVAVPLSAPTRRVGDAIQTEWTISNTLRIRQTVSLMLNPFSGRVDLMRLEYTLSNIGAAPLSAGVRAMLDVRVGENDAAPYFVSRRGRSALQQEFNAPDIPAYYVSFESNDFSANSLKGFGLLSGYGLSTPDRVQIANWRELASKGVLVPWEHSVTITETHGDSAIVTYWNPRLLAPGASYSVATAYGLAGQGGGAMWLIAPVFADPGTSEILVEGWLSNTSTEDFGPGAITLTLPGGMSFAPAISASQTFTGIPAGQSRQHLWRVGIDDPLLTRAYTYTAQARIIGLSDPLTASARTIVVKRNRVFLPMVGKG